MIDVMLITLVKAPCKSPCSLAETLESASCNAEPAILLSNRLLELHAHHQPSCAKAKSNFYPSTVKHNSV